MFRWLLIPSARVRWPNQVIEEKAVIEFKTIPDMFEVYGEPCSNCIHSHEDCFCEKDHRQKKVAIYEGHIPEVTVREKGGCSDHEIQEGNWWGEEPIGSTWGSRDFPL